MKQILGERVGELRKNLGFKQGEFAKKLGLTGAAISAIELDKAPLTDANIRLICLTFGVNEEWLREGKGEMMDDEAVLSDQERQLLAFFRELSPLARKMLIEYAQKLVADEQTLRKQSPEGAALPPEAQQAARGHESTDGEKGVNPIHDKKRG